MTSPHACLDDTPARAPGPASLPLVSIVLVNWNGLADTQECLESLARITYPNYSVVVVDNGSRNGDAAAVRAGHPGVTVLETGRNLGFAGGNNVGIREALQRGADYVLCLNNDTVVDPGFLEPLVQALEDRPDAGIVTAAIYHHDQPERLSALGCWVDLSRAAPVGHLDGAAGRGADLADIAEVAAVDGCVLMMRRAVAVTTGGFDDRFFAYVEDADLCLRARRDGWRCLAVPASRVRHKIGSTTGGENSPRATHYYMRNCHHLAARHGSPPERALFRRRFHGLWLHEWESYLVDGYSDPAVWRSRERLDRLVMFAVNVYAGRCGLGGVRDGYRGLEAAFSACVRLRARLASAAIRALLAPYARGYWKLNALSPAWVRLMPRPWIARTMENQERRRRSEGKAAESAPR